MGLTGRSQTHINTQASVETFHSIKYQYMETPVSLNTDDIPRTIPSLPYSSSMITL